MRQIYYQFAFGENGTITPAVPMTTDPNGFVSFSEGWTFDYTRELQPTPDPLAKSPTYENMNYLEYVSTLQLKQYQENGIPEWIDSTDNGGTAFPYAAGAMVLYSSSGSPTFTPYMSLVDNNTDTPPSAKWVNMLTVLNTRYVWNGNFTGTGASQVSLGYSNAQSGSLVGQVICQIDETNFGPVAFLNGAGGRSTFTSNVQVNGGINTNANVSASGTMSAGGIIVTSSHFSSQNGLITSGSVNVGITNAPDPVGDSTTGVVIVPQGQIISYSSGSEWSGPNTTLHAFFNASAGLVGSITTNGSSTFYNTTSDRRLKANIVSLTGSLDVIAAVPVYEFAFIDDITADNLNPPTVSGWIADEVQLQVPEAVTGVKNGTETSTNAVLNAAGNKVVATGVSQADWQAGKLAVAAVAPVAPVAAQAAVAATATSPAIPAVAAVEGTPGTPARPAIYSADSTWQASVTLPVYQTISQDKMGPRMWGGLQEARARIIALETTVAAMQATIATMQTAIEALQPKTA